MVSAQTYYRFYSLDWLLHTIYPENQERGGEMNIKKEKIKELTGHQLVYFQNRLKTRQSLRKVANYIIVADKTGLPDNIKIPVYLDGQPDELTFRIIEESEVI